MRVAAKWKYIGLCLCFSEDELGLIDNKHTKRPLESLQDMLSQWLRWGPPDHEQPAVSALADALKASANDTGHLADELENNFIPLRTLPKVVLVCTCS